MVRSVLDSVSGIAGPLLYLVIAGFAFAETAIFVDLVVPGEAGMILGGAAGHQGGSPLPLLILSAATGATLGDSVSYAIGRRWGIRLLERWDITRRRMLPSAHRAEAYFHRRGGSAVFVGRWVGALRAVVPVVAGTAGMPFHRFLAWNVAASLTWAATVVSVGFYVGARIADGVDRVGGWVSLGVVALLVAVWVIRRRRRRAPDVAS